MPSSLGVLLLRYSLRILRRHWRIVVLPFLLLPAAGYAFLLQEPVLFESRARILLPSSTSFPETAHAELVATHEVLEKSVKTLSRYYPDHDRKTREAMDDLRTRFRTEARPGAGLVIVVGEDTEPDRARETAESVANAYAALASELLSGRRVLTLLNERIERLQSEIRQRREKLPASSAAPDRAEREALELHAQSLEAQRAANEKSLQLLNAEVEQLDRAASARSSAVPVAPPGSKEQKLLLEDLSRTIAGIRERNVRRREIQGEQDLLSRRIEAVRKNLDSRMTGTPASWAERQELDRLEGNLVELLNRRDSLVLEEEARFAAPVRAEPAGPALPQPRSGFQRLPWLSAAGLIAGLCAAWLLELLTTRIRTEYDVRRYINLPLLATIPRIADESRRLLPSLSAQDPLHDMFHSAAALLRTAARENEWKTFLITSSLPSEGKSTLAVNLASALAISGAKVLLIDADLRRPSLMRLLSAESGSSFPSYLRGEIEASALEQAVPGTELHLIATARAEISSLPLLLSARFRSLLKDLRPKYDLILLDAPPAGVAADPLYLAPEVDAVLLVVSARDTSKEDVARSKRLLLEAGGCLGGVLLNHVSIRSHGYYYYRDEEQGRPA